MRSYLWVVLPLALGVPALPSFLWASWRLRRRRLAAEAAAYGVATAAFFWLAQQTSDTATTVGGAIGIGVMAVATSRAFVLRREVFGLAESTTIARPLASEVRADPWTPPWRTGTRALESTPADRHDPSTWTLPFACTGEDRHHLGPSLARSYGYGAMGLSLIALGRHFHVQGRGVGLGIGLLFAPLATALFAQRLDGSTLRYRVFGVPRTMRLGDVVSVTARGTRTLVLADASGRTARVGVTTDWLVREHLRRWLQRPDVALSAEAAALLDDVAAGHPRVASRRDRRIRAAVVSMSLALVAAGVLIGHERVEARAIDGASGYRTFTGPRGETPLVGLPWGRSCEPVLFILGQDTPVWIAVQIATVIDEARRDGIDVALQRSENVGDPTPLLSLYYPEGLTTADAAAVGIFVDSESRTLPNGDPERLHIGWDTAQSPDGRHEFLVRLQGNLHLPVLEGDGMATRRAVRQLIAFSQGVYSSDVDGSGIKGGSTVDAFSTRDVDAMRLMSGCGDAALSTVAAPR